MEAPRTIDQILTCIELIEEHVDGVRFLEDLRHPDPEGILPGDLRTPCLHSRRGELEIRDPEVAETIARSVECELRAKVARLREMGVDTEDLRAFVRPLLPDGEFSRVIERRQDPARPEASTLDDDAGSSAGLYDALNRTLTGAARQQERDTIKRLWGEMTLAEQAARGRPPTAPPTSS